MTSAAPSKHALRTRATRKKILDSAEALFAGNSVKGVSLRQITAKAGVDLALVRYHFGSKQDLFDAVVLRRAEVMRTRREAALDQVLSAAGNNRPGVEAIISAYVSPLLEEDLDNPGWNNYFAIIGRLIHAPEPRESSLGAFFDPMIEKFVDALRLAMPGTRDSDLYWCCHFMSGTLSVTFADTDRLDRVSGGTCRSADRAAAVKRMIPFLANGFRGVCEKT